MTLSLGPCLPQKQSDDACLAVSIQWSACVYYQHAQAVREICVPGVWGGWRRALLARPRQGHPQASRQALLGS
jgi:hypothetical protein